MRLKLFGATVLSLGLLAGACANSSGDSSGDGGTGSGPGARAHRQHGDHRSPTGRTRSCSGSSRAAGSCRSSTTSPSCRCSRSTATGCT